MGLSERQRREILEAARYHRDTMELRDHTLEAIPDETPGRESRMATLVGFDRQGEPHRFSVFKADGGQSVDGVDFEAEFEGGAS